MLNFLTKLLAPSTIIFIVGLFTVLGGVADYLLDQEFIKQYGGFATAIATARLVIEGVLKVARVFLPTFGLGKKK